MRNEEPVTRQSRTCRPTFPGHVEGRGAPKSKKQRKHAGLENAATICGTTKAGAKMLLATAVSAQQQKVAARAVAKVLTSGTVDVL